MKQLLGLVYPIVDWFVPAPVVSEGVNTHYRANVLVIVSIVSTFSMFPSMVTRYYRHGADDPLFWLLVIAFVLLVSSPFLLKLAASVSVAGVYLTGGGSAILLFYTFIDGGFHSPALLWFPLLPLFAVFFSGVTYGAGLAAVVILDVGLMHHAHSVGWIVPPVVAPETLWLMYAQSVTGLMIVLVVLAISYVGWQRAIQEKILVANRARTEFLSGMSHELRTPLNSILGFSEMLSEGYAGDLNEDQRAYIGHVTAGAMQLKRMVDDLLKVAQIESGETRIKPRQVRLDEAIAAVVDTFTAEVRDKGLQIDSGIGTSISSQRIAVDPEILHDVLVCLVSNAIKFAPEGSAITIRCELVTDRLSVSVSDEGPGVAEADRELIFERFYQTNRETHNKTPGTGVGLHLARRLAMLHGGSVEITAGGPTTFVVTLPVGGDREAP